jgi:sugar lactone lactonase YvrE
MPRTPRTPRIAVVAALLATAAFPVAGRTAPAPAPRAHAPVLPDRTAWDLGNGTFWSPVTGRTITLPGAGPSQAESTGTGSSTATTGRYDDRLAGQRRSTFYTPQHEVTGPGRVDLVGGGLCDGIPAPDVSVEPGQVAVDTAGRVFWIDHGARAHFKGGAYVRTIDTDGTVRTLGSLNGPIEGRHLRDFAAAEVMARIVPDDHGGVYYSHSNFLRYADAMLPWYAGDDQPIASVIGHLDAQGNATYVAGTAPSEAPMDGPLAEAAFQAVTGLATDHAGHLFVADGPVPWRAFAGAGASPYQRSYDPTVPGDNDPTSGGTQLRVVNLTDRSVTYADGAGDPVVAAPRAVTRIGGVRENGTSVDPGGGAVAVSGARFGFVPSIALGADGVLRLLQIDGTSAQLLAVNVTPRTVRAHGFAIPSGRVVSVAGSDGGYAGDGGPGRQAQFDFRITQTWFYGAVAVGADGAAYVSDTVNNRLRRVDAAGKVTTVAGTGAGTYKDEQVATRSPLWFPMGVAAEPDGGVLVSDWYNARIRRVAGGRITTLAGDGVPGLCNGARNDGTFTGGAAALSPHDTATDSRGNTYVADVALGVVQRIAPDGSVSIVAGKPHECHSGSPAYMGIPTCPFVQPKGDGGPPERAVLQAPAYLVVDKYDNLYVSDGANVRYVNFSDRALRPQDVPVAPHTIGTVFSAKAVVERVLPPSIEVFGQKLTVGVPYDQLIGLTGLALDKDSTLYVADLNGRRIVSITYCGLVRPIAGTGGVPPEAGAGDGGPAATAPVSPVGLALDQQRQLLYVASPSEQRVRVINVGLAAVDVSGVPLLPGFITTLAGGGRCVGTMAPPFVPLCSFGDGLAATKAAMTGPYDVAVSDGGRVYVGDGAVNVVRVVETDGDIETIAGVTPDAVGFQPVTFGAGGYCGDRAIAYRACFGGITGLDLRPDGGLVVSEMMTGIVRRIADAPHAPVRPLVLYAPPRGAGWTFASPVVLDAPDDVDVRDPDIAIARDGTGYVLARQVSQSQGAAGCALWRYTISRTARADIGVALPEPDGVGPVPGLDRGVGRSCALGVTREPSGSLVPPLGDAVRLGFASTALLPDTATVPVGVESAITGASRSGGQDFVRSPAGVVGASVDVRVPRIGVEDGSTTFYLAYCCAGADATNNSSGIAVSTSIGGIQYQPQGVIQFDKSRSQMPPVNEKNFIGRPVVRGDRVLVPFYAIECGLRSAASCTTTSPRVLEGFVARSDDGGKTFSNGPALFRYPCDERTEALTAYCFGYHGVPDLAADKAGHLAYVWDDGIHVYLRTSADATTWTPPVRVDHGVSVASYATVVAGDSGKFAVAFLGSSRPVPAAYAGDAEWYLFLSESTDGGKTLTQSLATQVPVHVGQLCQLGGECIGGGQLESVVGNWFHATVNPVDGRVVVAVPSGAGRLGPVPASRVAVVRQCSGPPLTGNAPASPCDPARPPAPHRPAPPSTERNVAVSVLGCTPPEPLPAPPPPSPAPHPSPQPRPTEPPARRPDRVPPVAAVVPGVAAGAAPPPLVQPGNAPQPNAQPEANGQAVTNPVSGMATEEQERTELAEELAMAGRQPDPPLVPWALATSIFAAAGLAARQRTRTRTREAR